MRFWRKYVNNRGSALFMVISTMTALMISCMAMYFSVISSRSVQYTIFNQQQSKQVSISLMDTIVAGINDNTFYELKEKLFDMEEGDKLTTESNGFAAFSDDGAGADPDQNLGAYKMEVQRLENIEEDGIEYMIFDFIVTSNVGGENNVYRYTLRSPLIYEEEGGSSTPAMTQPFAATGYTPNDVYVQAGRYYADFYFDNETTYIKPYQGGASNIYGDFTSAGSVVNSGYIEFNPNRPTNLTVRGTYTATSNQPVSFKSGSKVLIGGDCVFDNINGFVNADVYILGDLYIRGSVVMGNSNYYVGGNVYIEGQETQWGRTAIWLDLSTVRCNGIVDNTQNTGGVTGGLAGGSLTNNLGKTTATWDEAANASDDILSPSETYILIAKKTSTTQYYKWTINSSKSSEDGYLKELDESRSTAVHKTIKFSQQDNATGVASVELKYSSSEKGCIIDDVQSDGYNHFTNLALIIDTGEDPDNVYTIRVKANRDLDGDGVKETFMWYPYATYNTSTVMQIYVKGRGSVIIDIPENVTYQDMTSTKFMHYGWFVLAGGTERSLSNGNTMYYSGGSTGEIDAFMAENNFLQFIHQYCEEGDGCVYKEKSITDTCSECGNTMTSVICDSHGELTSYCQNCNPEKKENHIGECAYHIDFKLIDEHLAAHPDKKARMLDSKGEVIYPHVNIYLVSSHESANIRFAQMLDGTVQRLNIFCGYVYAPYMTYRALDSSGSGAGQLRLLGGFTVSDYILEDTTGTAACWPSKMPTELMDDNSLGSVLSPIGKKNWKLSLTGIR